MAITLARSHQLDQLSGTQKVAILCMVLGSESASLITQKLAQEEVEQISFEIARMDRVSSEATEAVLAEWLEVMLAADSIAAGGIEFAREVLERAFGAQKSQAMLKRIQAQISETAGLHRLRNADPQQLGNMLRGEHPQTVALILAHLEPQHTAARAQGARPVVRRRSRVAHGAHGKGVARHARAHRTVDSHRDRSRRRRRVSRPRVDRRSSPRCSTSSRRRSRRRS